MSRYRTTEDYAARLCDIGYDACVQSYTDEVRVCYVGYAYYVKIGPDRRSLTIRRTLWRPWTQEERDYAAAAAHAAEKECQPARIAIEDNYVKATITAHIPTDDEFPGVFEAALRTMIRAIDEFVRVMRRTLPRPPMAPLPVTKLTRADRYRDYLLSIGFDATVNANEDVEFAADGRRYRLSPDQESYSYAYLYLEDHIATVTSPADRQRAEAAIRKATRDCHAAEMWVNEYGHVTACAVMRLSRPTIISDCFQDGFRQLNRAVDRFTAKWAATQTVTA